MLAESYGFYNNRTIMKFNRLKNDPYKQLKKNY